MEKKLAHVCDNYFGCTGAEREKDIKDGLDWYDWESTTQKFDEKMAKGKLSRFMARIQNALLRQKTKRTAIKIHFKDLLEKMKNREPVRIK